MQSYQPEYQEVAVEFESDHIVDDDPFDERGECVANQDDLRAIRKAMLDAEIQEAMNNSFEDNGVDYSQLEDTAPEKLLMEDNEFMGTTGQLCEIWEALRRYDEMVDMEIIAEEAMILVTEEALRATVWEREGELMEQEILEMERSAMLKDAARHEAELMGTLWEWEEMEESDREFERKMEIYRWGEEFLKSPEGQFYGSLEAFYADAGRMRFDEWLTWVREKVDSWDDDEDEFAGDAKLAYEVKIKVDEAECERAAWEDAEAVRRAKQERERLEIGWKEGEELERKAVERMETEGLEHREKAGSGLQAQEEAGQIRRSDPLMRKIEIERVRQEWSDSDLDMQDRILALKREFAPIEAECSRLQNEYSYIEDRVERELRRECEDQDIHYWTLAEIDALPIEDTPLSFLSFRALRQGIWRKYQQEAAGIEDALKTSLRKCEDMREAIFKEERNRDIFRKRYDAELMALGASIDQFRMRPLSGVEEIAPSGSAHLPDTVVEGLPIGMIGCIAGPGGIGKTQLVTQIAFDVACGRNGRTKGGVLLISGEDDRPSQELRRAVTLEHMCPKLSEAELVDIRSNFLPWHMEGMRADLADGQDENTLIFQRNLKIIERNFRRRGIQFRLIVLDTLSNFNAGKENQPEQATALLDALLKICLETGASLIYLHHTTKTSKSGGGSGVESVRGHSILSNNVKWVSILNGMSEKEAAIFGVEPDARARYVKLTLAKCNYLSHQEPQWLMMDGHGILVPAVFPESSSPSGMREGGSLRLLGSEPEKLEVGKPGSAPAMENWTASGKAEPAPHIADLAAPESAQASASPQSEKACPATRSEPSLPDKSFGD